MVCNYKLLSCGIDSLDVGVNVFWGSGWEETCSTLEAKKQEAAGTKGVLWDGIEVGDVLVLPSGKPPRYRFHLQTGFGHCFVGVATAPSRRTPNVYVSFSARTLWLNGIENSLVQVRDLVRMLGGRVDGMKPSRADLCADFLIPGGLSLDFLRSHLVGGAFKSHHYENNGKLETYYAGNSGSPIQMRIYDKALEVATKGDKPWLPKIWGLNEPQDVWRIEYQLRRDVLKQFHVNAVSTLILYLAGLWKYLTGWISLRLPDDSNTTRRTLHPLWEEVINAAGSFGEFMAVNRSAHSEIRAPVQWYVQHMAGCLVSYAARRRMPTFEEAMKGVTADLLRNLPPEEFDRRYRIKTLQQGRDGSGDGGESGGEYPPGWDGGDV